MIFIDCSLIFNDFSLIYIDFLLIFRFHPYAIHTYLHTYIYTCGNPASQQALSQRFGPFGLWVADFEMTYMHSEMYANFPYRFYFKQKDRTKVLTGVIRMPYILTYIHTSGHPACQQEWSVYHKYILTCIHTNIQT